MKRFLVIVFSVALLHCASAQDFRMGAKSSFNSTWLFNSNISDKGDIVDYHATFGVNYGLQFLLYFTENIGVSMDLIYANNEQRLEGFATDPGMGWYAEEQLKYLDIPILFHLSSDGGPYLEIGPQVSLLLSAKEYLSWSNLQNPYGVKTTKDYKGDFNSVNVAGVLGFGYDIEASDNWFINVGLRFAFGLTDATKDLGSSATQNPDDVLDATYALNKGFYNFDHSKLSQHAHWTNKPAYEYHPTNRAFGGLQVGVIYKFK